MEYLIRNDWKPFLLTRLLRGATVYISYRCTRTGISTHTPLARRDLWRLLVYGYTPKISTHTPLARRDSYI